MNKETIKNACRRVAFAAVVAVVAGFYCRVAFELLDKIVMK